MCCIVGHVVMYHCMVTAELTPANAVSTKLRNAARGNSACGEAPITDILHRGIAPEAVLDHWSQRILADFKERNPEIKDAKPDMLSLAATVNQHGYILNVIAAQQQQMLTALQKRDMLCHAQETQLSYLSNKLVATEGELANARGQLAVARQSNYHMQSVLQSPVRKSGRGLMINLLLCLCNNNIICTISFYLRCQQQFQSPPHDNKGRHRS